MIPFRIKTTLQDTQLAAYRFDLPPELIAQNPPPSRGDSRLLVHDRKTGNITATMFSRLIEHLPPGLLVVNNSRVVPARIIGSRASGGKVEFLLTTPLPHITPEVLPGGMNAATVSCLLKSSKKVRVGETILLDHELEATILERGEFGKCDAKLIWTGNLSERLSSRGLMPLPPYIKRPISADDAERYQTVYSDHSKAGSIAAPTAGLHFTPEMREALAKAGITWAEVTLYVGYGTFSPVRCDDVREHVMHHEYCEISEETARLINQAKADKVPVTAVGTTAARTLEGVAAQNGAVTPFQGWTDIFLYPGKPVRVVDHLLTNFHLPESTLLMLVSAFAGREAMLQTYAKAVEEKFRFFSYGDAMLIL
ncbi:tRNA preQ1(34) S-adenosylmethionine ribosyltransferase-isomerase QueA [Desulfovibrio sp. OttesenSCG-928-O18]|nr:tRNA preQ1(34) S-adenosylmethionine ribosyltransferase-isomerase QueA [Desulfovibrio sp. OttesenSCG-928-O18]